MAGVFKNVFGSQPSGAGSDDGKPSHAQLHLPRNLNLTAVLP
jgi:hypothetical protein